ncbi:MAG: 2-oxo acid dehydrogenase subunit E2 [Pseudomonadales bacterium]|nr:2-oxo acid dehydrogenase subunit E2 [Pseudomonadales bacterium]NIX09808.1 2-oxo acid dehydrogenase subunit E2 [Pseudomonadales bacterium]
MPTEIYLVKVGMNMTEGVVEEWYIPDGGTVEVGELLYRLETEKVNLDVDAEVAGTVKHLVGEGVTMKPGEVVGYVYAPGEEIPDDLPAAGTPAAAPAAEAAEVPAAPAAPVAVTRGEGERILSSPAARRLAGELGVDIATLGGSGPGGRIVEADVQAAAAAGASTGAAEERGGRSSPMARKVARELGVDIATVTGTGPGGRITKEDVENAAKAPAAAAPAAREAVAAREDRNVPVRGMRKTIAARMHESLQTMAQLTMDMDVIMDDAVKLRGQLIDEWTDEDVRPTYTDLVIRAAAKALEKHPLMNSVFTDTEMTLKGEVNVGMAVALEEGLIVPVIRHANLLSMKELARESSRLAAACRDGSLTPDDLQGGTFTVSALGMFGVDSFTPIINSPQAGILGVNRLRDDVAWDGAVPVKRQAMRLSLTWDHRALDGAPAAQFLASVRDLLEAPYRLLV